MKVKTCNTCNKTKPLSKFSKTGKGGQYIRNRCTACLSRQRKDNFKGGDKEFKRRQNAAITKHRKNLKELVMGVYGGGQCSCCGEAEMSFLTIDHMKGGGTQHRKELNGFSLYKWLVDKGFPSGYQVLCFNCNFSKFANKGVCAHKLHQEEVK